MRVVRDGRRRFWVECNELQLVLSPFFLFTAKFSNSVLGRSTKMLSRRRHQAVVSRHGNEHQSQLMSLVYKARKYGRKSA
jgi:hypothetical protein